MESKDQFWSNLDPANAKVAVCEALVLREDLLAEYLVGERDVFFGHLEEGVHVAPIEVVQRLVNAGYSTLNIMTPARMQSL